MKNQPSGALDRIPVKRAIATFIKSKDAVVGHIVDIGADGLSFLCKNCRVKEGEQVEMDIFLMDSDIYLPKVNYAIKVVEPCSGNTELSGGPHQRINGIFPGLSAEQAKKIALLQDLANQSRTNTGINSTKSVRAFDLAINPELKP